MVCAHCGGYLQGEAASSTASPCRCADLTVIDIKASLKAHKLRVGGKKNELLARLRAGESRIPLTASEADEVPPLSLDEPCEDDGSSTSSTEEVETDDIISTSSAEETNAFAKMPLKELKALCKSRKLPMSGNKPELVERLTLMEKGVYVPKKRRPKRAARQALQKSCRSSTIKTGLKSHLVDPVRILPHVTELVDFVSKQSRHGALAVNALLLHHLDRVDGGLPAWLTFDATFFRCCFTGGKLFTGKSSEYDEHLAEVPAMVDINRTRPAHLKNSKQSTTYAAQTYCTVFKNHNFVNFRNRVRDFCSRLCAHSGVPAWTKKQRYLVRCAAARFVFGEPVVNDDHLMNRVPPLVMAELGPLRTKVATCGLRVEEQPTDLRATVETLYFLLQRTHAFGFKGWSVAPLHGFSCRHVKIDIAVFKEFFIPRLVTNGFYSSDDGARALAEDSFLALFKDLPRRSAGWEMNASVLTDGYSLCVTYVNANQARPPQTRAEKREAAKYAAKSDPEPTHRVREQFIGNDPGNVNLVTLTGFNGHGERWFRTEKTSSFKNASGERAFVEQTKRRTKRVQPDLDALCLEGVRVKTPLMSEFARYLKASADHNATLWQTLGHKHTARARLSAYFGSQREHDALWNSVPLQKNKRLVMVYGAASWTPGAIHARIAAPCTRVYRHCAEWVKRQGGRMVMADECFTSQKSPFSHNRLKDYYINGKIQRGLKCDRSSHCLRLFLAGHISSCALLDPSGTIVLLSRDRLGAINIRETVARGQAYRPRYLRQR